MNRLLQVLSIFACLLVTLTLPAQAATKALVQTPAGFQDVLVPPGQSVENVLLIGKDGLIAGKVTDEVVVINGNLTLTKTAKIADRVFVIGGHLHQEPGAQIGKDVFNISTSNATFNSVLIGLVTFAGIEIFKLAFSVGVVLATLFILLLFPNPVHKTADRLRKNLLKTALLGFLGTLAMALLIAALLTSIWGIPLALMLGLIWTALAVVGFTSMGFIFGELFSGHTTLAKSKLMVTTLGSFLLIALINLPVIGPVWAVIVGIVAFGATIQLFFKNSLPQ